MATFNGFFNSGDEQNAMFGSELMEVVAESQGIVAGDSQYIIAEAGCFDDQLFFGVFNTINRILFSMEMEIYF